MWRPLQVGLHRFFNNLTDTTPQRKDAAPTLEKRYAQLNYLGNFRKTLPTKDGKVAAADYLALRKAVLKNDFSHLKGIAKGLADPRAAYYIESYGPEASCYSIGRTSPQLDSDEMTANMLELYGALLLRDVPFSQYPTDPQVAQVSAWVGMTPATLFRFESKGPVVSQLLLLQPHPVLKTRNYLLTHAEYDQVHSGTVAFPPDLWMSKPRYLTTLRDLASFTYVDYPVQAYQEAALYLMKEHKSAFITPYKGEAFNGFLGFGTPFILDLLNKAIMLSKKATWYHKWLVHRLLRPEELGYEVDRLRAGRIAAYDGAPTPKLLHSPLLELVEQQQGNVLMSSTFPEGSPTHPSFPSGHGACAGAGITILKALFQPDYLLSSPMIPSADGSQLQAWPGGPLRLEDELNKLGFNMAMGRVAAGIHYRADNEAGLLLGEKIALRLLTEERKGLALGSFRFRVRKLDNTIVEV